MLPSHDTTGAHAPQRPKSHSLEVISPNKIETDSSRKLRNESSIRDALLTTKEKSHTGSNIDDSDSTRTAKQISVSSHQSGEQQVDKEKELRQNEPEITREQLDNNKNITHHKDQMQGKDAMKNASNLHQEMVVVKEENPKQKWQFENSSEDIFAAEAQSQLDKLEEEEIGNEPGPPTDNAKLKVGLRPNTKESIPEPSNFERIPVKQENGILSENWREGLAKQDTSIAQSVLCDTERHSRDQAPQKEGVDFQKEHKHELKEPVVFQDTTKPELVRVTEEFEEPEKRNVMLLHADRSPLETTSRNASLLESERVVANESNGVLKWQKGDTASYQQVIANGTISAGPVDQLEMKPKSHDCQNDSPWVAQERVAHSGSLHRRNSPERGLSAQATENRETAPKVAKAVIEEKSLPTGTAVVPQDNTTRMENTSGRSPSKTTADSPVVSISPPEHTRKSSNDTEENSFNTPHTSNGAGIDTLAPEHTERPPRRLSDSHSLKISNENESAQAQGPGKAKVKRNRSFAGFSKGFNRLFGRKSKRKEKEDTGDFENNDRKGEELATKTRKSKREKKEKKSKTQ